MSNNKSPDLHNDKSPDRIILIDKPAGMSSFGVVARVRRGLRDQFGRKIKVGHTGTLDPFATGLLILLSGKMTKKSGDFLKLDKTYEATLKLGFVSTTGDPEGEITPYQAFSTPVTPSTTPPDAPETQKTPNPPSNPLTPIPPSRAQIEAVLAQFTGEISQTVPKFSAVKINGQRAYKLARQGTDFTPPTRKVTIYRLEILSYDYPELKIRCEVSSGTYIRTLAEDIGQALGTGAYLTALRRTKVGPYELKSAQKLDEISPKPS